MAKFSDIINQSVPVLVDFKADWCGPCKTMAPILSEVKSNLSDNIKIIKIDIDQNQAIAQKFQIRGVPTLVLFKDGKEVWRQSGVIPANQLTQLLNTYL